MFFKSSLVISFAGYYHSGRNWFREDHTDTTVSS